MLRRMLNFGGVLGAAPADGGLSGGADEWVERLAGWATEHGIDTFVLWPGVLASGQVESWGREVAPAVRAEVERRRQSR